MGRCTPAQAEVKQMGTRYEGEEEVLAYRKEALLWEEEEGQQLGLRRRWFLGRQDQPEKKKKTQTK
jgi:hypothetical protein